MIHWTEDDFKNWLYGLKDDDGHLGACDECRAESERIAAVRRRVSADPEVSPDFLSAQRRAIYGRLTEPRQHRAVMRWAVSLATVIVLAGLSIAYLRPNRAPQPIYTYADEQLFSDLAQIEQTSEPRAIQPMHNLFEE